MALKTMKKKLQAESVPEVARFMQAQQELDRFMQEHQQFVDELQQIAEQYNDALEAADKALRTRCDAEQAGVSAGPFEFKHFVTKYDADALLVELHHNEQDFMQLGGSFETIRQAKLDPNTVEMMVANGAVPEQLQRCFIKRIPNYSKPKKLLVTP